MVGPLGFPYRWVVPPCVLATFYSMFTCCSLEVLGNWDRGRATSAMATAVLAGSAAELWCWEEGDERRSSKGDLTTLIIST